LCLGFGQQVDPIPAHDLLVKTGGMSQILFWTSFAEIFGGIALFQTIQGKRAAGDYSFDPLSLSVRRPHPLYPLSCLCLSRLVVSDGGIGKTHHIHKKIC
jgi:hypothetical protein